MGREKDSKGDGKTKDKAKNLKRLSDRERAGAVGDAVKNRWMKMWEQLKVRYI